MAKTSGLGDNAYVGVYDLSGDICALTRIGGGPALLDVTAIDNTSHERIGGTRDGEISFQSWFDDGTGLEHDALSPLQTTDLQVLYFRGTTLGNPAAGLISKQINLDHTRGADGSLQVTCQALANAYGLEWGVSLTAGLKTDAASANGDGVDFGGAEDEGLQAYLVVTACTNTSLDVIIQESSDDAAADAYANVTGGAFTQTAAATTERIATAVNLAVEQWLRAISTIVGAGSSTFAVMVHVNEVTPAF